MLDHNDIDGVTRRKRISLRKMGNVMQNEFIELEIADSNSVEYECDSDLIEKTIWCLTLRTQKFP